MRKFFYLTVFAFLAFNVYAYTQLPQRVAIHFNAAGQPDNWASREVNLIFGFGLALLFFAMVKGTSALIRHSRKEHISIPNRDYWLAPEHQQEVHAKLNRAMHVMGIGLFIFFIGVEFLMLQANQAAVVQLPSGAFLVWLILFLIFTAVWVFYLFRSFQIPKS